jgi:hypothetical protein
MVVAPRVAAVLGAALLCGCSGAPAGPAAAADAAPAGQGAGATCNLDGDCASGLCRQVVPGGLPACVVPCAGQADCASLPNGYFYCEPVRPGALDGYCVPPSPSHCATCMHDAECGSLAERCVAAGADAVPACHVGPAGYACCRIAIQYPHIPVEIGPGACMHERDRDARGRRV